MLDRMSLCLSLFLAGTPAAACQTALLLAIDVSQSIDVAEYRYQTDGMADAVLTGDIADALLAGEVALSVVQWSGADSQVVSIPWMRMRTHGDIRQFADAARTMRRAFIMSNTGVGQVMRFGLEQFGPVADCARRVIDISGDGHDNAGTDPREARNEAERQGIEINGLAIEGMGGSVTSFYRRNVITRGGFVLTARGYRSYARTLREKIKREISQVMF